MLFTLSCDFKPHYNKVLLKSKTFARDHLSYKYPSSFSILWCFYILKFYLPEKRLLLPQPPKSQREEKTYLGKPNLSRAICPLSGSFLCLNHLRAQYFAWQKETIIMVPNSLEWFSPKLLSALSGLLHRNPNKTVA
jgi:hypothetical protein